MRRLCVFWCWVMERAEDISTLPKTTIKLRDSVSHFPHRQIQLFSNAWKITRVSSHNSYFVNTSHLAARTSLYEPLVAPFYRQGTEEQWPKLPWECTSYVPPDPCVSCMKTGQGGMGTHLFYPSLAFVNGQAHLGSAFGLSWWRTACGGPIFWMAPEMQRVLMWSWVHIPGEGPAEFTSHTVFKAYPRLQWQWSVFSPLTWIWGLTHNPKPFSLLGQTFQRASHFTDYHEFWQHTWTAECFCPPTPRLLLSAMVFGLQWFCSQPASWRLQGIISVT